MSCHETNISSTSGVSNNCVNRGNCTSQPIHVICNALIIPPSERIIGTQYDKNSNKKTFILPTTDSLGTTWADKSFYVITEQNGVKNKIEITDPVITEDNITLTWLIDDTSTLYEGEMNVQIEVAGTNYEKYTQEATFEVLSSIGADESIISNYPTILQQLQNQILTKQDTLVSGENIKTINNESILGAGNLEIDTGLVDDVKVNGVSVVTDNVANIDLTPYAFQTSLDDEISIREENEDNLQTQINNKQDTISDLSTIREGAAKGDTALQPSDVINNTTSTETNKPVSANVAKELQDAINNLKSRGRFLALWNAATGLAQSNPTVSPYTYQTGDYFIVGNVATGGYIHNLTISGTSSDEGMYTGTYTVSFSVKNQVGTQYDTIADITNAMGEYVISANGTLHTTEGDMTITGVLKGVDSSGNAIIALTDADLQKLALTNTTVDSIADVISGAPGTTNYKPNGTQYIIGQASTTVETSSLAVDDVYYYDGENWRLQVNTQKTVSFANIAGQPSDNSNLAAALNDKVSFTDYASFAKGGVIKNNSTFAFNNWQGNAYAETKTFEQYSSGDVAMFIGKGTLENVITGKNLETASNKVTTISSSSTDTEYPSAKAVYDLVGDVESLLNNIAEGSVE